MSINVILKVLNDQEEYQKAQEKYFWIMTYVYSVFKEKFLEHPYFQKFSHSELQDILNDIVYDFCTQNPQYDQVPEEVTKAAACEYTKACLEKLTTETVMEENEKDYKLIFEFCPECSNDVIFHWDFKKSGYIAHCPVCGSPLSLCSYCNEKCDWNGEECKLQNSTYTGEERDLSSDAFARLVEERMVREGRLRAIAEEITTQEYWILKTYDLKIERQNKHIDDIKIYAHKTKDEIYIYIYETDNSSENRKMIATIHFVYHQDMLQETVDSIFQKLSSVDFENTQK